MRNLQDGPFDWKSVKLVVFDVDGTLYSQRCLRLKIGFQLILHSIKTRSILDLRVLRKYRNIRETMAELEIEDFDAFFINKTAAECGVTAHKVKLIVSKWIDKKPIDYLANCRFDGVQQLFEKLRNAGVKIAIFSDYPAQGKIFALGLKADFIACAGDLDVGFLKPNPKGLNNIISQAGETVDSTLMIGDRISRDGRAAQALGVRVLIKSRTPIKGWETFRHYSDEIFKLD
jgi:putative hydrolase of the HAD superfamily